VETITIPEDAKKSVASVEAKAQELEAITIQDQGGYDHAGSLLVEISKQKKKISDLRLSITRPMNEAIRNTNNFFKKAESACDTAKSVVQRKMIAFKNEQERIRKQKEAELQEKQRKEAERLEKRAEKAEEKGQVEKAEALREQSAQTSMMQPTIQDQAQRPEGTKVVKRWKFEITDPNQVPRNLCIPDEKSIRALVNAQKENCRIAGVRVWSEENIETTGR